jgi:alpha/beta superfamily hydrolase
MNIPKLPTETKPFLWGAAVGAITLAIVGFSWGGWVTGGASERSAAARGEAAIVSALTPLCVARFQASANASDSFAELKKTDSWERGDYVQKAGWATMPGGAAEPNREVAIACAEAIGKLAL